MMISFAGCRVKSLTAGGALAAFAVGACIFAGLGFSGLMLLGIFFGTSSLLSKFKAANKKEAEKLLEKGDRRDSIQVMANGGVPAVLAVFYLFLQEPFLLMAFFVSIAAANSDTWASEIGTLSKGSPRMLLSLKKVPKGTSGAVSLQGTFAAIAGAALIAAAACMIYGNGRAFFFVLFFGFLGNLADTFLGGSIQAAYQCPVCGKETERKIHCEVKGELVKGFSFFNNDAVNFLSILLAAVLAAAADRLFLFF
ncbi:DUF92 domain-containing protein [Metabacillus sp. GX 13764]|uniref:DUF92 domain-containing protein n=1 Tax=Metabacillus kandeliae TaxID=2900151 RepID=UPI001E58D40A|nr:DUF92 domain-containing protein [Metabacillus kandeliae]MCD7033108.1 DUF92 domain-containing protein [Metabacillus kandeliae]